MSIEKRTANTFKMNLAFRGKLWHMKWSRCSRSLVAMGTILTCWQQVSFPFSHSRTGEYWHVLGLWKIKTV